MKFLQNMSNGQALMLLMNNSTPINLQHLHPIASLNPKLLWSIPKIMIAISHHLFNL